MSSVNLRNTSGVALFVAGRTVEVDGILHVEGAVAKESPDDAYLIGDRLWPKAHWSNAGGSTNTEPDVKNEENA